jgi:hypothetical protein
VDSVDDAGVAEVMSKDNMQFDTPRSFDVQSQSGPHADTSEKDDQHSDGEESSYSFI